MLLKSHSLILLLGCLFNISLALNYPQNFHLMGANWTGICKIGREQTPINIQTEKVVCDDTLDLSFQFNNKNVATHFTYHGNLDFYNKSLLTPTTDKMNPNTYQLAGDFETLFADDLSGHHHLTWELKQIHFHSPSQHLVDGQRYDAEIHLVHEVDPQVAAKLNLQRPISLVGIFLTVDDDAPENPLITAIDFKHVGANIKLNFKKLLSPQIGDNPEFYAYKGSLKMPPCDEVVNIYLVKRPLKITAKQLLPIIKMLAGNGNPSKAQGDDRIPQPLYDRVVSLGNADCKCPIW